MTKCEKAQDHINEYLNNLKELYEEFIRNQNNS